MKIDINYSKIIENIEKLRVKKNMSVSDLSIKTGIKRKRIIHILNGTQFIKLVELVYICNQLEINMKDILEYKVTY